MLPLPKFSVKDINLTNRTEYIEEAWAKFDSYDSSVWRKGYFDEKTGGYNVYHIDHNFSKAGGGGKAEKTVGKILAKNDGKQMEFLPEIDGGPDVKFDGFTWDIKYIDIANEQTIRNHIKDAKKADNAIFYFTKNRLSDLNSAMNREIGRFAKQGRIGELPNIYYVNKNGLFELLWKNEKK